ncbi:MAG: hypothetical protein II077_05395 [Treponema sp.]|nr:hypothetical protein [Treponema sp.]
MKKTYFLFLFLLLFCYKIFADSETALRKKMKTGESIELTGSFVLWNGFPPNVRFQTCGNKIIGIGKDEEYSNEAVERIISRQLESGCVYTCRAKFTYIGDADLPPDYYDAPLMCFTVSDLKIEAACMEIGGIKIDIGSLKFDKKLRRLKCRLEVSNLGKQPLGYSNMFLYLRYDGKKLRAYKDSPASNMIDFSKVEIPSNGKLKEAVYFNFDDDVQMDFARLEFFYE